MNIHFQWKQRKSFPAFGFEYEFELWTSISMQLAADKVVGDDRLNRALSYVFYFKQCSLACPGGDLYISIIRTQGCVPTRCSFSLQISLKYRIHQNRFEIYEKLKHMSAAIGLVV